MSYSVFTQKNPLQRAVIPYFIVKSGIKSIYVMCISITQGGNKHEKKE